MCKVSVIVPVYRVENYIDRCMQSLLGQTLKDIEIVCVCEKEDLSFQHLNQYAKSDSRVRVIEKKNTGVSSARNMGIKASKGKYIAFVDGDDWIERYTLKTLYNVAEKYHTDIICYGMFPTLEPPDEKLAMFGYFPKRNTLYCQNGMKALFYEHGSRPYIGNKFYKRDFLVENDIKFDETLAIGEDQLLQFEAFNKAKRICYLREKFYHYEIGRKDSAMAKCENDRSVEEKNFELLQKIIQHKEDTVGQAYDKDYLWFVLQDFSWIGDNIQNDYEANQIMHILQAVHADENLKDLPQIYVTAAKKLLQKVSSWYETKDDREDVYETVELPPKIVDEFRNSQVSDIQTPIHCFTGYRRIYEAIKFHEGRHLMARIERKIGFIQRCI